MQFHLNGFRAGDPDLKPEAPGPAGPDLDVLIVGTGPAGLTLAAYLAGFPKIRTAIVEQRAGPLERGQADGVSCRSMEMFNCFGFVERVMREAYWVNESVFWKPDPDDPARIVRSGRVQDVEDGLSELPHVILNQARVHDMYLEVMRNAPTRLEPLYSRRLAGLDFDADDPDGRVTATLERSDPGHEGQRETLRARYVVGCDGARSQVRREIGRTLEGDHAHQAWGVMDVLLVTDFPDIRYKCLIQSESEGSIVLIPREGGYLVRLYVELDRLNEDERVVNRDLSVDDLIAAAGRILSPYVIDVKDVVWWSVYEIGQRLTDKFDDVPSGAEEDRTPRVFIAGDACHTHSPKAGQGMNVSMGDAFNLGWKLVSVLQGRSGPDLLHSYSGERQAVAQALIDFDQEWTRIISTPASEREAAAAQPRFQEYFIQHGRYTAGLSVQYDPSALTGGGETQGLATGFTIGMRFQSAPVIRLSDGRPMHLGHVQEADARWTLFAFAGGRGLDEQIAAMQGLCTALYDDPSSPLVRFTPPGQDLDAVFDLRAVLQSHHHDVTLQDLPLPLRPLKGRLRITDHEKVFCADHRGGADIFDMRGVDRERGCLVIVRPDQYVADVLPLDGAERLSEFFDRIFVPPV